MIFVVAEGRAPTRFARRGFGVFEKAPLTAVASSEAPEARWLGVQSLASIVTGKDGRVFLVNATSKRGLKFQMGYVEGRRQVTHVVTPLDAPRAVADLFPSRPEVQCRECCARCSWVNSKIGETHFRHCAGSDGSCSLRSLKDKNEEENCSVDVQRLHEQTPWHRSWSRIVRPECREVSLHGRPRDAALRDLSCIVEFQHSRMPQAEFLLRCMTPIKSATWIFDVTDRLPWLCEDKLFIDLPSAKFDWDYSADSSFTLIFQASDNCLYESISKPMRVFLGSELHLVRAVCCFDPSKLPDVFHKGEVRGIVKKSSSSHRVELLLKSPVSEEARLHLPMQAELVDEMERHAADALSAEQEHAAQRARQAEKVHRERLAEKERAAEQLAHEKIARDLACAARKDLAEDVKRTRLEEDQRRNSSSLTAIHIKRLRAYLTFCEEVENLE